MTNEDKLMRVGELAKVVGKTATDDLAVIKADGVSGLTPAAKNQSTSSITSAAVILLSMPVHRIESGLQHVTKPATVDLNGEVPTSSLPNPGLQLGHPFIHSCVPFLCIGISATSHAQRSNRMLEVESVSACSSRLWLPTQTQAELYDTAHKVHLCRWGGGCKTE